MISFALALIVSLLIATFLGLFNFKKWKIEPENAFVTQEEYDSSRSWSNNGYNVGDRKRNTDDPKLNIYHLFKAIGVLVLFLFLWTVSPLGVQRIDAGCVGLKIDRIGNDKGIPVARPVKGWVFFNEWTTDVVEYSIRQNHIGYGKFSVPTKGGVPMDVAPSFNYSLKPEKAAEVYINLLKGGDFDQLKDSWIATATNIALKNATNEFNIDSIFNHQSTYQQSVEKELNKEMSKYFVVSQINPGQVTPPSMANILNEKGQAIQQAQKAELTRITAVAQAQADMAKARGDSASRVISAAGEAEAIRLTTRELSDNYVQYIKWVNANPDVPRVPQTVLGSGTNVLLSK